MTTYLDTSFFLALLNRDDRFHAAADREWKTLMASETALVCSNYVLLETLALVQNRLGMEAVADFQGDVAPLLSVEWVDASVHEAALAAVLAAKRRNLSLVDCVSFEVMRRKGIRNVHAFDKHFREQGFHCRP